MRQIALRATGCLVTLAAAILVLPATANALSLEDKTRAVLEACLAAGKQQKIDGKVGVDGSITLTGPALRVRPESS